MSWIHQLIYSRRSYKYGDTVFSILVKRLRIYVRLQKAIVIQCVEESVYLPSLWFFSEVGYHWRHEPIGEVHGALEIGPFRARVANGTRCFGPYDQLYSSPKWSNWKSEADLKYWIRSSKRQQYMARWHNAQLFSLPPGVRTGHRKKIPYSWRANVESVITYWPFHAHLSTYYFEIAIEDNGSAPAIEHIYITRNVLIAIFLFHWLLAMVWLVSLVWSGRGVAVAVLSLSLCHLMLVCRSIKNASWKNTWL